MKIGSQYGCLTVLDLGEEYYQTEQYLKAQADYHSLESSLEIFEEATDEDEKRRIIEESNSSFIHDLREDPSSIERIYDGYVKYRKNWIHEQMSRIKPQLDVHYKCLCKCGKIHYFDAITLESTPKYCYYPMFISQRSTYSVRANNATYNKRQKYGNLMNVVFVSTRSECIPSDEYCGLWNMYKQKQINKTRSSSEGKKYTVEEWDNDHKKCATHEIEASSHLEALQKLYPQDTFDLVLKSDIRNRRGIWEGDFDFRVSNHYGNSAQNRTRLYKRVKKK